MRATVNRQTSTGTLATAFEQLNPFFYKGYYYDADLDLFYCASRYFDWETSRWLNADAYVSTGQGLLGHNMFAYCGNNPVMYEDPTGESLIDVIKEFFRSIAEKIFTVKYDVPLYDQGDKLLCWAYSQTMVEDYHAGVVRTQEEADERAMELAILRNGEKDWNRGSWPTNWYKEPGKAFLNRDIDSVWELRAKLLEYGPIYAYHKNEELEKAHLVVITGVNPVARIVYTNNPWGISGAQTYDEFLSDFAGNNGPAYRFDAYILVK